MREHGSGPHFDLSDEGGASEGGLYELPKTMGRVQGELTRSLKEIQEIRDAEPEPYKAPPTEVQASFDELKAIEVARVAAEKDQVGAARAKALAEARSSKANGQPAEVMGDSNDLMEEPEEKEPYIEPDEEQPRKAA